VKFTPARNMNRTVTHWMAGEKAPSDAVRVENPPVAIALMAWFTASKGVMPRTRYNSTSTPVSNA
jgi:hypothetical protein